MSCCGVSNHFRCGSPSQNVVPAETGPTSHWKMYERHPHANICLYILSNPIISCDAHVPSIFMHSREYLLISWVKGEATLCQSYKRQTPTKCKAGHLALVPEATDYNVYIWEISDKCIKSNKMETTNPNVHTFK